VYVCLLLLLLLLYRLLAPDVALFCRVRAKRLTVCVS
jgi:hypothetical protein